MSSKIKHRFGNSVRNWIKKSASKSYETLWKLITKCCKFLGKSSFGAVLEHFGRSLGAKMAQEWHQEQKLIKECWILGRPVGSKMEPKSIKHLIKNRVDFCNDFECLFLILGRFWLQKPLQNEVPRGLFFNLVASIREVWFWTTLLWFCFRL